MQTVSIYATKLRNSLRQTHILQGFRQTQYPNLIEPPTHFQPLNWPILHILCRFFISLQASHYHKSQKRQREKKPHIITCRTSGGPLILPVKMFFFLITLLGWCISCVHLFKRGGGECICKIYFISLAIYWFQSMILYMCDSILWGHYESRGL